MATTVTFDGVDATDVTVASTTSLTCTVPAGTAGTVDVVVSTTGDSVTVTDGYTYEADAEAITGVSPDIVYFGANTISTYTGENLPVGAFTVNSTPRGDDSGEGPAGILLNIDSATEATGNTAWRLGDGGILGESVTFTVTDGATVIGTLEGATTLTELATPTGTMSPTSGPPRTAVTITGTGFVDYVNWGFIMIPTGSGSSSSGAATRVSDTEVTASVSSTRPAGEYDCYLAAAVTTTLSGYVNIPLGTFTVTEAAE